MSFNLQGWMPFETFRNIINVNKPFDTGRMFLDGNRFFVTESYLHTRYDIQAVPYIYFQEKGTKFFDGNKGFIEINTITELNQVAIFNQAGITSESVGFRDASRAKSTLISQGTLEHIKGQGSEASLNVYVG